MPRLKVFRTPAGFHDAYVAATSRKAALAAWGSEADLFARGMAEEVTDPALTEAPLARPGEVIKVARTMADAAPEPARKQQARAAAPSAPKPKPRPSRAALDRAEAALAQAEARHAEENAALKREEEALAKRRAALVKAHGDERTRLERARRKARDAYDEALAAWQA